MFRHILVAVDVSPASIRGLRTAIALAKDQQAQLHVMHVFDDNALPPEIADGTFLPAAYMRMQRDGGRDVANTILANAVAMAEKEGIAAQSVLIEKSDRDIAHSILAQARKMHADVIVLGTHGRRGLRRLVMGSDAEAVVREAKVPVLLVRGDDEDKQVAPSANARIALAGAVAAASRVPASPKAVSVDEV